MKKLYFLLPLFLLLSSVAFPQVIRLRITEQETKLNINGQPINKGDEFDVFVWANGNNNTTGRALYFDFQFQNTALDLVSVNHTGTIGNGGVLPSGSTVSMDQFSYPGYSWLSNSANSTTNGNTNYNNMAYGFASNGPSTILRVYITWAVATNANATVGSGNLLRLRFRLKTTAPGFAWDPIRMNFGAAFNRDGSAGSTLLEQPLTTIIGLDPIATSYVNARIETNSNISPFTLTRVLFLDSATNIGFTADATSDGKINVDQTRFKPNTVYMVNAMVNMDSMKELNNAAVTVSDYTTALAEFISQNLDGTFKNNFIKTGAGYISSDINRSKTFDGGDVTKIFSQSVSLDNLIDLPQNYQPGTDAYMSVPTFTVSDFNNLTPQNWRTASTSVRFRTGAIGSNLPLTLRYVLVGDINRSHSSQVRDPQGLILTSALPSLLSNTSAKIAAVNQNDFINTFSNISSVNVNLNNLTVLSDNIEIPVRIDTKGEKVAGLQFEFTYDHTKIKFEEVKSALPNGWFVFGTPKEGKIKFGGVDRELKNSITGVLTPFVLKFSALQNGADLTTQIRVSPVMDAADQKGNQLGIVLSTSTIKLTGYNNFN